MKPCILPNDFLRRMNPKDRPTGKAGMTTDEAQAKYAKGQEKRLQTDCANLLRQRNIWFRQMPFGKKTPWPGWPDFVIVLEHGFPLFVECKVAGGEWTEEQRDFCQSLPAIVPYHVIYNLTQLQSLLPKL